MSPANIHQKRILLSPLNWGLGHVSRCIGLIRMLQKQENEVIVACDADQQQVFESYFPELEFVFHAGYPFEFSGNGNFASDLFNNRKKLLPRFAQEQKEVAKLVEAHRIDLVIADQRYGFFSTKVPSVFVTHQLHLPLKWYQFPAQWFNARLIQNFTSAWCMDNPTHTLAGKLSAPVSKIPVEYIGHFSRFEKGACAAAVYDKLFVISGPEPYAEQFFREVLTCVAQQDEQSVCLVPHAYLAEEVPAHIEVVVASHWKENDALFHQSRTIVSRAGYSTLMDLEMLGKKAVLIPTPGQSEQQYLAALHAEHPDWIFCDRLE